MKIRISFVFVCAMLFILVGVSSCSLRKMALDTAAVKEGNPEEFKKLLNKVLEIDPGVDPENRLINTLNRRKARWLLSHPEDFFIPGKGGN